MRPPAEQRPKEPQSYPLLPAAGKPPAEEAARATNVSFGFPGKRWFNRPWSRLINAELDLETSGKPTLVFTFGDMMVKAKFLQKEEKDYLAYWQSYLDGRLTLIEEKPEVCEIKIIAQDVTENFTKQYPPVARGGTTGASTGGEAGAGGGEEGGAGAASDEPPNLDDDGPSHYDPSGPDDDFEEPDV